MKFALDIQKIEREKRIKRCQDMKEIASPLNHKINKRKERLILNPKVLLQSRQN